MKGKKSWRISLALGLVCVIPGCLFTSKSRLNESETQNRILSQQNRAQLIEIENLKNHGNNLQDSLARSEEEAARLKEQIDQNRQQAESYNARTVR
jgi:hypothetical protein